MIESIKIRWAGHAARMERREVHRNFWWGNLREGDHLENPGLDGRMILKLIFEKWDGVMDWIGMAQESDRCRAVVNAIMNFGVHK